MGPSPIMPLFTGILVAGVYLLYVRAKIRRLLAPLSLTLFILVSIFAIRPLLLLQIGDYDLYGVVFAGYFNDAALVGLISVVCLLGGYFFAPTKGRSTLRPPERESRERPRVLVTCYVSIGVILLWFLAQIFLGGGLQYLVVLFDGRSAANVEVQGGVPAIVNALPVVGAILSSSAVIRARCFGGLSKFELLTWSLTMVLAVIPPLSLGGRRFLLPSLTVWAIALLAKNWHRNLRTGYVISAASTFILLVSVPFIRSAGARAANENFVSAFGTYIFGTGISQAIREYFVSYDTEMFDLVALTIRETNNGLSYGLGRATIGETAANLLPNVAQPELYSDRLLTSIYGGGCSELYCPVSSLPGALFLDGGYILVGLGMAIFGVFCKRFERFRDLETLGDIGVFELCVWVAVPALVRGNPATISFIMVQVAVVAFLLRRYLKLIPARSQIGNFLHEPLAERSRKVRPNMNFASIAGLVKRSFIVLLILAILGGLGGFLLALASTRMYSASTTLYVSSQVEGASTSSAYQGGLLSEQRVKSYSELVKSPRVTTVVAERLGAGLDPSMVSDSLTVTSQPDTVVLSVSAVTSDPNLSAEIANTVSGTFIELVAELERPVYPGAASPIAVRIVSPAVASSSPVSPSRLIYSLAGAVIAAMAAFGVVYLRDHLDRSMRSGRRLADTTSSPTLGAIPLDNSIEDRVDAFEGQAGYSRRAEAFRQLRANLEFTQVDRVSCSILITSSVSSEGKSSSAINLAISLAEAGSKVLLVDADMRRPRLHTYAGVEKSVGLSTVLSHRVPFSDALQRIGRGKIDFLASGRRPPNPSELLGSTQFVELLDNVRPVYDYVIIDSPPLLPVADSALAASKVDGVILLCRYGATREDEVVKSVSSLRSANSNLLGCVLTAVPESGADYYGGSYYDSGEEEKEVQDDLRGPWSSPGSSTNRVVRLESGARATPPSVRASANRVPAGRPSPAPRGDR